MSSDKEGQIKSDLFKDVKYYVTGTIEPEVILNSFDLVATQQKIDINVDKGFFIIFIFLTS